MKTRTIVLGIAASITTLGALAARAGDLAVDNLTVSKDATFYGKVDLRVIAPAAPTNNLDLFFSFATNTVPILDDSGNGNTGGVVGATWTAAGKTNGAYGLDGTNDYLTVVDASAFDFWTNNFAIAWWENRTGAQNGAAAVARDSSAKAAFVLGRYADGDVQVFMSSDGANWDIANARTLGTCELNAWTHYLVTRSGTNFYAYKNAVLEDHWTAAAALCDSSAALELGRGEGTYYFAGKLDEVRLYRRAFSSDEVRALYYYNEPPSPEAGTIAASNFVGGGAGLTGIGGQSLVAGSVSNAQLATSAVALSNLAAEVSARFVDAVGDTMTGALTITNAPLVLVTVTNLGSGARPMVIVNGGEDVQIGSGANGYYYGAALGKSANGTEYGVGVGIEADGHYRGGALGYQANAYFWGSALGYQANGYSQGAALGYQAKGDGQGAAVGMQANATTLGAAVGYQANGYYYGVALGSTANGSVGGVAVGSQANGSGGLAVGAVANGGWQGAAVGPNANAYYYGVAIGSAANGYSQGTALGGFANGTGNGLALGNLAKGDDAGLAVGYGATGDTYGAALGYQANAQSLGVAVGRQANGYSANIAIGPYADALSGTKRIALGYQVTNDLDESARLRGSLFLDGGTGVFYRATFGSGAWSNWTAGGGAQYVLKAGDTMNGGLNLAGNGISNGFFTAAVGSTCTLEFVQINSLTVDVHNLEVNHHAALGWDATVDGGGAERSILYLFEHVQDFTNPVYSSVHRLGLECPTDNYQSVVGVLHQVETDNDRNYTGLVAATQSRIRHNGTGQLGDASAALYALGIESSIENLAGGTLPAMNLLARINNSTGTMPYAAGVHVAMDNNGVIENSVGVHVTRPNNTGLIANRAGVLIEDQSGIATADEANLFSEGVDSINWFEGRVYGGRFLGTNGIVLGATNAPADGQGLFVAVSGGATNLYFAAAGVSSNAVTTDKIADGTILTNDLNLASVDARYVLKTGDTVSGALFVAGDVRITGTTILTNAYVPELGDLTMGSFTNGAPSW